MPILQRKDLPFRWHGWWWQKERFVLFRYLYQSVGQNDCTRRCTFAKVWSQGSSFQRFSLLFRRLFQTKRRILRRSLQIWSKSEKMGGLVWHRREAKQTHWPFHGALREQSLCLWRLWWLKQVRRSLQVLSCKKFQMEARKNLRGISTSKSVRPLRNCGSAFHDYIRRVERSRHYGWPLLFQLR